MEIPENLRYTTEHEWARTEGSSLRIGITDFAQQALGDVVFVDLPDVGEEVVKGGVIGEVESTKSVSEIYAPVGGRIVEVNSALADAPESLNSDPYGSGWLCVIEPLDQSEAGDLLGAEEYAKLTDA